jgi:hypothetical protein
VSSAYFVVMTHVVLALLLGWLYFRRYKITRPPIGVLSLGDVAFMLAAVVVVPLLYLALPVWLVASLLALGMGNILYIAWEPVLRHPWLIWLVTLLLISLDVWAAFVLGAESNLFFAANNLILVLAITGATNLWAQSGLQARHAAILAGGLMLYDYLATSYLPLMNDLVIRLVGLPFAPLIAWNYGAGEHGLAIGLGDLLLATLFPLVMRKAYGRSAGLVALTLALVAVAMMLALLDLGIVRVALPAMVVLGPLMIIQLLYWRRHGQERTTWQYLQAEPL